MNPAGLKNWPPLLHRLIGAVTAIMPALELMDRDGVNHLPVMTDRQAVGMLNREDVITSVRTLQELGT
jgi:signal-transduction protein with cAMP-binding, CBS, and nucleotidyltransferase domain